MGRLKQIRVMLVDDNEMVRMGLAVFLETCEDMELVAEADNGDTAITLVKEHQPDVVLMDLIMPVMDGVTATTVIRRHYPQTQVVVLTSSIEHTIIEAALDAGAVGYLRKSATIDEIADAVRSAYRRKAS
jgi:two-component system, NarL family, response regulator LiaR